MANNVNALPPLYSKNEDGSINIWSIMVNNNTIITQFGRVGGAIQTTSDTIKEGKNEGKANATTPFEQAVKEAKSKWTKKKKSGYVETKAAAGAGQVDAVIEGGIEPMLAHKFRDHAHKISYPAYVQPKLDGIRCIAILKNGKCTLWSRTRKPITGVPHIAIHIERAFAGKGDVVLDGELFNMEFKADFEKIVSYVRQVKPAAGHEIVQYHIYDTVRVGSFAQRSEWIKANVPAEHIALKVVDTVVVQNEDEVAGYFNECLQAGYEGAMVRNAKSPYKNARSYDLQKVKEMQEEDYPIVGVEEGRGRMAGMAIFVCKTESGKTFSAKMEGRLDDLRQYLTNHALWKGKLLSVRFQNLTADGIPRFPIGKSVRFDA